VGWDQDGWRKGELRLSCDKRVEVNVRNIFVSWFFVYFRDCASLCDSCASSQVVVIVDSVVKQLVISGQVISRQPLPSNRQHPSYGDCLEGKREDYLTRTVLLCITIVHIIYTPIYWAVRTRSTGSGFDLAWLSCFPSASVSLVYLVLYVEKNLITSFSLPFSVLSLWD